MATEPPTDLWKLWKQEQISTEMAIGYLIQNQVQQEQAMSAATLVRTGLRNDLDGLVVQVKTHQKILEALQQAFGKLQSAVDGLVRSPKQAIRKDKPNTNTQN